MSSRFVFALLLMGSTVAYQIGNRLDPFDKQLHLLYGLSGAVIILSAVYGLMAPIANRWPRGFVYLQIVFDVSCVSLIIVVTGGYASVFSFLYLVVVIYSSVFVFQRGTLVVAALCSFQFTLLLMMELNGTIDPFGYGGTTVKSTLAGFQVFQKSALMAAACFAVALLSGYLADQERLSKAELAAMEAHLGRVQNLAQIGEMAAGLAHEIKNPLASLSGAIQILEGEMQNNADHMRLMHIVLRETERLSSLVNNFLTFARPCVGQTQCINVGDALTEIVTLFEKDSSITTRIKVDVAILAEAFIDFDPLQLRQVVWNLLLNGAESIQRHGRLTLTVRNHKHDRTTVTIADDGCGMDEKTVKAIFNPFFTTKPNGTGLGLSIVCRILETYGCRLDVTSTPGRGSMFTMVFRRVDPALMAAC